MRAIHPLGLLSATFIISSAVVTFGPDASVQVAEAGGSLIRGAAARLPMTGYAAHVVSSLPMWLMLISTTFMAAYALGSVSNRTLRILGLVATGLSALALELLLREAVAYGAMSLTLPTGGEYAWVQARALTEIEYALASFLVKAAFVIGLVLPMWGGRLLPNKRINLTATR